MTTVVFSVQGSAAEPYEVTFLREGTKLSAYCSCPAGQNGQYCKHRFSILSGEASGVVSTNVSDIALVASWLPGSNVALALDALARAERDLAHAQKVVSAAKKAVAAAMR